jgi:ureidoacrylate peracid hydrolase
MHTLNIPPAVLDRIVARRGRLHMIEAFEPPRTAVLAVDMQVAYLSPDQPGFSQNGVEIIPAVNALILT